MIDDELETELRGTFARAGAGIAVPQQARQRLLQRGYRRRAARRRLAVSIAAAATVAGAAVALTTLAPASPQPVVHLTAWTVSSRPDGDVVVTIRELRHPGGLARKLRADGIPASVIFGNHLNPSCRPYPGSIELTEKVFPASQPPPHVLRVTIRPSALPGGAGVQIYDGAAARQSHGRTFSIGAGLVRVSRRCTG